MAKVLQCPCGFAAREADDESLIEAAQLHARSTHGIELTREQALAMAKPEQPERGRQCRK